MNFQRLQHFVAVAGARSMSAAAVQEGLSQPALSKSIAKLEEEVGMRLFDRQGSLELTALGRQVLKRVRDFVEAGGDLGRDLLLLRGGDLGELQIGCGPIIAESLLGPAVARLMVAKPGLHVRAQIATVGTLEPMLRQRQLDFALGDLGQLEHPDDYELIRFPPADIVWFVRRGHPLAAKPSVSFAELFSYPIVTPALPDWVQAWFDEQVPEERRPFRPAFECSHHSSLVEVVRITDLICASTMGAVARDLRAGVIELVHLSTPVPPLRAGVIFLKRRSLSPPAELLIREIMAQIENPGKARAQAASTGRE